MAGQSIIDTNASLSSLSTSNSASPQSTLKGVDQDYQKLFALYRGLTTLNDIATQASGKNLTALDQSQLAKAFANGLTQVSQYVDDSKFTNLRLALGADSSAANSTLKIATGNTASYIIPPVTTSPTADVPAYDGNVQFNISIKRASTTFNIPIDLNGMGSQTRSLANVINYVNSQLSAAGVGTRFASNRTPAQPQTITVGKQTVTVGPGADQYGLKINVGTSETVTFGAPQTAGALYMTQSVGDPDPDHDPTTKDGVTQAQLVKFQTDTTNVPTPLQATGQPNFVDGRVFATNLDPDIKTVRATQVGADGSVYMIADVTGKVNGQSIQADQDVALMKYDSTGQLIYTRTLGASDTASGLGLAVSADGKVAVTGSVTGALNGSTDGAINSGATGSFATNTDSFVTLYDASGNETWTERRGARLNDDASQATFGADGTLYVAGRAQGQMPSGGAPQGGYDSYIEAFTTSAKGVPSVAFTQSFGTSGDDRPRGMVVDGNNLITATVEGGHGVLRTFDISSGTPVQTATRDLGDLQGGDIAGLALNGSGQIVVAGTSANGALNAGNVTSASSGGSDAFVAQLSEDLSSQPTDAIAYYGGSGNDRATSVTVSNGQVYIAGVAGTDLPGQPAVGKQDGFVANIDVATGAVSWSRRFTGKDGVAAPLSIAAAPTGASVLDRLGLPNGPIHTQDSQQLAAQSALRPGMQFSVTAGGVTRKVTIDQGETYDTLVQKINRASGFEATASVTHALDGTLALKVIPAYSNVVVQLGAGPQGLDALPILGLPEGDINLTTTNNGVTKAADGGPKIYGLGLSSNLNLNDPSQTSHALSLVSQALGIVRTAYQDLVKASTPASAQNPGKTGGTVPTYMTDQLANLQAGLARLTGGASTSLTV